MDMSLIGNAPFGRFQMQHLNLSNLMQWGDHLCVGNPVIDAQHQAIFNLGKGVYEQWRGDVSIDALRPSVYKLEKLVQAHFAYEEKVLADIGYDGLKQHALEHLSMLD